MSSNDQVPCSFFLSFPCHANLAGWNSLGTEDGFELMVALSLPHPGGVTLDSQIFALFMVIIKDQKHNHNADTLL